jgi:hypothetical protein
MPHNLLHAAFGVMPHWLGRACWEAVGLVVSAA